MFDGCFDSGHDCFVRVAIGIIACPSFVRVENSLYS